MIHAGDYNDSTSHNGGNNRLFFASPTKLSEQKPFRGFDISSLMRKDDDHKPLHRSSDSSSGGGLTGHIKTADSSPIARQSSRSSPPVSTASPPCNISLGPPAHHHHSMQSPLMHPGGGGGNPYTGLLNSGLYQQYLGQLLAANSAAAGGAGGVPPHPLNPMLLQAQLAALAAQNSQHLMAAAAGCYNNALTERLKAQAAAHRFAPYPLMGSPPLSSPPTAAPLGSPSPSGGLCTSSSAFKSLQGSRPLSAAALNQSHSPPVSPPHSRTTTPGAVAAAGSLSSSPPLPTTIGGMPHLMPIKSEPMGAATASPPLRSAENSRSSEIKNIENMINGLNGTSEGRFGLSH